MTTIRLDKPTIRAIAEEVVRLLQEKDDEFVSSEEAAKILGVTPAWLRRTKHKYPHLKQGDDKRGRLLFQKAALLQKYTD